MHPQIYYSKFCVSNFGYVCFYLFSFGKHSMLEPANTGSTVAEIDDGIFTPQKSANTTYQSSPILLPKSRLLKISNSGVEYSFKYLLCYGAHNSPKTDDKTVTQI